MKSSERQSGIDFLGITPWGTHFCMFYQTEKDLLDILVPYFKAGLENNEYCMWITSEPLNAEDAEKAMSAAMPDFKVYFEKRQIEIVHYSEWYLQDGVFDLDRVLNGWIEKLEYTLEKGFEGLRVTGNAAWLEKKNWSKFKDYEEAINNIINEYNILAICSYALEKCEPLEVLDVIQNHQFALIRREGKWNSFKSTEQITLEQKLRESEKKYRMLIENALEGIWIIDENSITSFVNPRMAEMLGYSKDEMLGKDLFDFIDERGISIAKRNVERRKQGIKKQHDFEFLRKNGTKIFTSIETSPITDEEGNYSGAIAFVADITERKKAEKALRKSEFKYRSLFDNMLDGYALCKIITDDNNNPVDFVYLEVNDSFERLTGLVKENIIGKRVTEAIPGIENSKPNLFKIYGKVALTGVSTRFEIFFEPLKIWLLISVYSLKKGYFVAIFENITERKQAEQKLKESEKRFRELFNNMSNGVAIYETVNNGEDFIIKDFNLAGEKIDKVKKEVLIGKSVLNLFPGVKKFGLFEVFQRVWRTGKPESHPVSLYEDNRINGWRENYIYKLPTGEIVAIYNDITERKKAEQKLKESEEAFRKQYVFLNNIIESLTHPFFVININDYTIELANSMAFAEGVDNELFCYSLTHKLNKPCEYPCVCPLTEVVKTKKPCTVEHTHYDKEGNARIYEIQGYPIQDENGNVVQMIEYAIDITERKIAEQKRKESEEKYRMLFESSPTGIGLSDFEGNVLAMNLKMEEMTGFTLEEFKEMNLASTFVDNDDRLRLRSELQEKGRVSDYEVKLNKKDGTIYTASLNIELLQVGEKKIFLNSQLDITERKKTEQQLSESEEKFRTITEQSLIGIVIFQDGFIKYANSANSIISGYPIEEITKWTTEEFFKVIYHDDIPIIKKKFAQKQEIFNSVQNYSCRIQMKSGKVKWIEILLKSIFYQNKDAILASIIDITEKKEAEQELIKLNNLKSELLRRTSHELKTPLVSIKGFSDLLLNLHVDKLDDYVLSTIAEIKQGCTRLETLISDILKTSELESGVIQIKKSLEDLSFLIRFCVKEVKGLSELRNHTIDLKMHNNLKTFIEKEQIHQVLSNLLTNAIKYTPINGLIEIKSKIEDNQIIISIRDNGIGFTEEEKTRIFKQFGKIERYGQGFDIISEGTGLGLYISKRIIELHDGKIWVESDGYNKGSTFYFSLPIITN